MKFSIITINYNNLEGLKRTVGSVFSQTCRQFEYIIVDGGSSDGSREYLQENSEKFTYWVSESDTGIYNAMNKGISNATGEFLLFLNSGDILLNDRVLSDVYFALDSKVQILLGNLYYGNDLLKNPAHIQFSYFYNEFNLLHQAAFIHKTLFEQVGLYNEHYKIAADWDFFIKAIFLHNAICRYVNIDISKMEPDGLSMQANSKSLVLQERNDSLQKNFPLFLKDYYELQKKSAQIKRIRQSFFTKILLKTGLFSKDMFISL